MIETFYILFMTVCFFFITICGFLTVLYLWHKSVTEFRLDDYDVMVANVEKYNNLETFELEF